MKLDWLIYEVKKKREMGSINDEVIRQVLQRIIVKELGIKKLENLNRKDIKEIVTLTRSKLRKYSSRFGNSSANEKDILNSHISTRERMSFYPELLKLLKDLKVKIILDIGCGVNPIAMAEKDIKYYACDINDMSLSNVEEYFKKNNISGKVFFFDVTRRDFTRLPSADLCILFKVLDVIEEKGHKLSEEILNNVASKYFLVSFSTKTLSGRPMNHPQRGWIERLLTRLKFNFKYFSSKNEIFYLAWRN